MFDYLHGHIPSFYYSRHEKKDKVQMSQQNEMLSLYHTALDFTSKNEEYRLENNI